MLSENGPDSRVEAGASLALTGTRALAVGKFNAVAGSPGRSGVHSCSVVLVVCRRLVKLNVVLQVLHLGLANGIETWSLGPVPGFVKVDGFTSIPCTVSWCTDGND